MTNTPICRGDTILLADVGNTRIKLAVLAPAGSDASSVPFLRSLPAVAQRQDLISHAFRPDHLENWLNAVAPQAAVVLVASVYDAAAARLEATLAEVSATRHRVLRQRRIGHADLPLTIRLAEPQKVGIDRLAAAAAACLVKSAGRSAIIVDCGTAATVDMLSADGEFLGGAILPGPALLAKALAEGTSRLPEVLSLEHGGPPPMPGRSTQEAIAAGIGWGMQGAVVKLVLEAQRAFNGEAEVILTGGWRGAVRDVLPGAIDLPDLVLTGIALAVERACAR